MSLHLPTRRLAAAIGQAGRPSPHLTYLLPRTQKRNASFFGGLFGRKNKDKEKQQQTPETAIAKEMDKKQKQMKLMNRLTDGQQGESIFDDDADAGKPRRKERPSQQHMKPSSLVEHNIRATDPDPRWRVRWQKKQIMKSMRSNRGPTKEELIRREERQMRSCSTVLPTSYKKLMHLARQVAGKTVDEALVQMRFSKKKMAREVRVQIQEARDQAVAVHGMGLAKPNGQLLRDPKKIQTKDGRFLEVTDPSRLYIDQAWVTKGPWRGAKLEYRARAKMNLRWKPTTRFNVILKEEKTRIRMHDEKVEKEALAKPWVHLPNRPVYHQRPYYSW